MTRLPWLLAAVFAYQAYACETGKVPKISELIRSTRLHFAPPWPTCGQPLVRARPKYRGWHTSVPT